MTEEMVLQLTRDAIQTMILVAGPLLISAMVVGIVISILQAITQINEATLTFIPKIVAIVVVLALAGPWMLKVLENYAASVITGAGEIR